jgi:hypothetical protein
MPSNKINKITVLLLLSGLFLISCSSVKQANENLAPTNIGTSDQQPNANKNPANVDATGYAGANSNAEKTTTGSSVARAACMTVDAGKRAVQKSQTFVIDFEPFKGSCFVTTYNPEYGDSHMESAYDIYKGGKKIFSFPGQFNGSTFGCWVDAAAFQDLNHDGLTDVIVAGKCAAKQADYNENMVYMNTGKTFTTREDGNNQLGDLKTIKEITDFVEDNQQIFF